MGSSCHLLPCEQSPCVLSCFVQGQGTIVGLLHEIARGASCCPQLGCDHHRPSTYEVKSANSTTQRAEPALKGSTVFAARILPSRRPCFT